MELTLIPERPAIPVNTAVNLPVLVRLTAPVVPQMERKPLNLCLVIDRSGSMAGEKLRQTIASARFVIQRLALTDVLSVVQFDERVKVVISPRHVKNREHLSALLDSIRDGGSTNLSGGWFRGSDCVREVATPDYVNRVILLTDGQTNHGIVDPAILVKHAAELTEEGITTTTLGYGEDFNEDLLISLADAGRGNAYHVETADQAPTIFARELEGLLAIAAQNVRVTFAPSSLVQRVDLCSIAEHHRAAKTLTVTLGDLVSEDTRAVLVSFRVDPVTHEGQVLCGRKIGGTSTETAQSEGEPDEGRRSAPLGRVRGEGRALAVRPVQERGPSPRTEQRGDRCSIIPRCVVSLGTVTVTYDDVVGEVRSKTLTHELPTGVIAPEKVAAIPPDAAVVKALFILRAAKVLEAAIAQADAGDVKGAIQRLTDFLAVPEVAATTDPEIQATRRRIKDTIHDLRDHGFDKMSRKQMLYSSREWSHGDKRSLK